MEYTPQELTGVLFYRNKVEDAQFKSDWERTRIQTYYLINIQLPKKNHISYEKFKKDIWPFFWEARVKKEVDDESIMNLDQWMTVLNKPLESSREISANEDVVI